MIIMSNKALGQGEGQIATVLTTATTERKVMRNLNESWTRKKTRNEIKDSIITIFINELTMKTNNVHNVHRAVHHLTTITAAHTIITNNGIAVAGAEAVVGVIVTDTPLEVEVHPRAMTLIVKS